MARLTVYLPDEVERQVRKVAQESKLSVSKWVADRVGKAVKATWSAEFLALAGALPGIPEVEGSRRGYGDNIPRESLD